MLHIIIYYSKIELRGRKWEKVVMYFGSYEHNLDDKGRLLLPKKLKQNLGDGDSLYIMKGFEGCLSVYNESEFQKLCEECSSLSFNQKNARTYLRLMLSSVIELTLDKVGRIQIPASTLNKFNIGKQVMIIGVGDHFEIWDLAKFNEFQESANENFESLAESLGKKDE